MQAFRIEQDGIHNFRLVMKELLNVLHHNSSSTEEPYIPFLKSGTNTLETIKNIGINSEELQREF